MSKKGQNYVQVLNATLCSTEFFKVDCTINMHCMLLPILFTLYFRYPDMIRISKWHSIFFIDPEIALSLYELQVLSLQFSLIVSKNLIKEDFMEPSNVSLAKVRDFGSY